MSRYGIHSMTKASRVKLPKEPTRKQQSRAQREAIQRRWLLIGVGVVLALTVGLLILGVVDERILKPNQPVARVGGTPITTAAFQKRVRYQYFNLTSQWSQLQQQRAQFENEPGLSFILTQIDQQISQIESQLSDTTSLGKQVLDAMIDEELIRQEAARRGIVVSAAEVTQLIEQDIFNFYRVPPTPTPAPTPLPTPSEPVTTTPEPTWTPAPSPTPVSEADFNAMYKNMLTRLAQQAGMTESDFRQLVENQLLRERVQKAFESEVASSLEHIQLRYVRLESDEAVQAASGRLAEGTPFDEFYVEVRAGDVVSATHGEIDWTPVDEVSQQFEPAVADQVLSLSIGQATGVITNVYGNSYIFQVVGREVRPLSETDRQYRAQTMFNDWLTAQRTMTGLVDYMNDRYMDVIPPLKVTQP